ncbi:c-type cytochrome [Helicobacter mustelae]|uniref:Putative ubiquinol-cytochrome C reductase cytochrome C subunit n=1 Tax=Helicobacter mustelae (strain ATCC 43772 / CCUG 25715 / CIP 103759 / LMG 18044 / NCTC 12198 / R85-136P) TaxID=679897 RepID=D3UGP6_HELM1|nr:c-type cytochrome [Helicobacter mustelae]CBG39667.1 putative ubiquinol-cytochrome C reductase cytochrome C subunit [Helicobacter mustelae 12198]SQH71175.1 ubiquinol-cytochrome C reductase cytochrome subunit C [Helicobacter mustelae]STP12303.1 ubiquinol-cytochrome C reductase cytochrome subunit C [Helicobacter mustelae]
MREIKILVLLIVVIGVIYWGVEPFAHSVMHPKVAPADFTFKDLSNVELNGDPKKGKELVQTNCTACHGIKSQGLAAPMDGASAASAFGVVPPDLSNVGAVFDGKYLAHFIADPVRTTLLSHKFKATCEGLSGAMAKECENANEGKQDYPMSSFKGVLSDAEIADVVAYLKSIAPEKLSNKEVFAEACQRCHDVKYDHMIALTPEGDLKKYLGTGAPDLSMMIRSKGEHYLNIFINDPQKELPGTPMPRVGLTQSAQTQVIHYIEEVGDRKKHQRDQLGIKIMIYFAVLAILAFAWKKKVWKNLH